jgi:hypothetical protein
MGPSHLLPLSFVYFSCKCLIAAVASRAKSDHSEHSFAHQYKPVVATPYLHFRWNGTIKSPAEPESLQVGKFAAVGTKSNMLVRSTCDNDSWQPGRRGSRRNTHNSE